MCMLYVTLKGDTVHVTCENHTLGQHFAKIVLFGVETQRLSKENNLLQQYCTICKMCCYFY